jgi:hypothetical protein
MPGPSPRNANEINRIKDVDTAGGDFCMGRAFDPNVHSDDRSNYLPDNCDSRDMSSDVSGCPRERTSPTTVMPLSSQIHDDMDEEDVESVSEKQLSLSYDDMMRSLGDGPMRFSPKPQGRNQHSDCNDNSSSSYSENSQISSKEKKRCKHLKKHWESTNPEVPFSYEMYLKLQNENNLDAVNRGYDEPEYVPFGLSIEELEPQLLTVVR